MVYVFDNAQIHLTDQVRSYLKCWDITAITLPQYSSHMNPIEKVFNVVKHSIMKATSQIGKLNIILKWILSCSNEISKRIRWIEVEMSGSRHPTWVIWIGTWYYSLCLTISQLEWTRYQIFQERFVFLAISLTCW